MRAVILLAIAACSATPKEPTITKEQQAVRCRPAIEHVVTLLTGRGPRPPMAARIRTALLERCTGDLWGEDAIACFGALTSIEGADRCATYLTIPQRDGFQAAIEGAAR